MRHLVSLSPALLALSALLLAPMALARDEDRPARKRNKVALIPVKCERDIEPELCGVLAESMALAVAKAPGLEVVTPADLEVVMGAQALAELSSCGSDTCFVGGEMLRIDAAWLLAGRITRVGSKARMVLRLVDLERGTVIDREEATPTLDEAEMDTAVRRLAVRLLARRGVLSLEAVEGEPLAGVITEPAEEALHPTFYVGVGTTAVGGATLVGAGALGLVSILGVNATSAAAANGEPRDVVLARARDARSWAYGADLLLVAGSTLVLTGLVVTTAGAF